MATSQPSSSLSTSATFTTTASSSSSSPLLYPSSCSSDHSVPLPPRGPSWSPSYRPTSRAHGQLESLIARHGRPTRFSLSSLEELTATTSTYNPPSPLSRPRSPVPEFSDSFEARTSYRSKSRPIPIPKRFPNSSDDDLPVTPLTGRFERDYFPPRDLSPEKNRDPYTYPRTKSHWPSRRPSDHHRSSRMRSDSSTFYSSVVSQPMPSSGCSDSPQPSRSRAQNTSKPAPVFHLDALPQFHPAVYQSPSSSQALSGQPPSPRQPLQQLYRVGSSSRDPVLQYRELVEGVVLHKAPSRPLSPSPAAPRLDPLRSPGPVTPLALEEAGGYITAGAAYSSELSLRTLQHSAPAPDLLERMIARESERTRQKAKRTPRGGENL